MISQQDLISTAVKDVDQVFWQCQMKLNMLVVRRIFFSRGNILWANIFFGHYLNWPRVLKT